MSTHQIEMWVIGFAAAVLLLRAVGQLVAARLRGVRFTAVPVSVWSELVSGLVFLSAGLVVFGHAPGWLLLAMLPLGGAGLVLAGIVSRTKAGLPWWRFGTAAPSPAADSADPGYPAGSLGRVIVADAAALTDRIRTARFTTTRFGSGYDEEEVDTFLDKLIADLGQGGRLDQAQVRDVKFSTTRLRPGYTVQDVDDFLDEVIASPAG